MRQLKLISVILLGMALIIVSVFASYYWDLFHRAADYDDINELVHLLEVEAGTATADSSYLVYDDCAQASGQIVVEGETLDSNTNWRFVFQYNAIVYTIFSGLIVCSFAGLIYSQLFQLAISLLQLTQVAHFVGLLLTAIFRFNKQGKACSAVTEGYTLTEADMNDLEHTFESDGYMLRCLFISQCVLFLPFCACSCIGLMRGRTAG